MREYGEADQAREHDSRAKAREARASSSILSRTVRDSAAGPVSAPPPTKRERSSSPFPTRPAAVFRLFARAPLLFLSHAGADTEAARKLKQRLEAAPEARERGLKVWFDKDDLQAGESWQGQLEKVVGRRATAFAVYVGSRGVVNWVEAEVRLALSRTISGTNHFPFIPILAAGADGSKALPGFARQFQAVRDVENDPGNFQKLVAAVLGGAEAGQLKLEVEPFFGLKAIDETRSHLFFGRERETQELVERLAATNLLMVTGDSGSGKSSLVRAGLVPRWRGGGVGGVQRGRPGEGKWELSGSRTRGTPH